MKAIARFFLRQLLRFYVWLWDDDAENEKQNYQHRKIIWELKKALKELEPATPPNEMKGRI